MDRPTETLPAAYFETLYAGNIDPWNFRASDYEHAKYRATLEALPRAHYERALEVGCSIGVLTHALAPRCHTLLAVDIAETALAEARRRCADRPNVTFARMAMPAELPDGGFDLIVISEVAYYWSAVDLDRVIGFAHERLPVGGDVVLVHWIEGGPDKPLSGDEVHAAWIAAPGFRTVTDRVNGPYRLTVLTRA